MQKANLWTIDDDILPIIFKHVKSNEDIAACMMVCSTVRNIMATRYKPDMIMDYFLRHETILPRRKFRTDIREMMNAMVSYFYCADGVRVSKRAFLVLEMAASRYFLE